MTAVDWDKPGGFCGKNQGLVFIMEPGAGGAAGAAGAGGGGPYTFRVRINDYIQTLAAGYSSFQAPAEKYKLGYCRRVSFTDRRER